MISSLGEGTERQAITEAKKKETELVEMQQRALVN